MMNKHALKASTTMYPRRTMLKFASVPLKLRLIKCVAVICCISIGSAIAQEASPVAVPVTTARRGTIVSTKQYTGHLHPQAEITIFANVSGKIVTLNGAVGQSIAKGDTLAEIDSSEAILAAIRAGSALSNAQSQLTLKEANAQTRIESQLVIAQEKLTTAQSELVETRALAEMRTRNRLTQAEAAYQEALETIEKSKTNAEQALERATVEHDDAQANYNREKVLYEKQHISKSNFESVEKRLKLSETRLEEAKITASQFKEGSTHPSVERAKAELGIARKLVEIGSWEREIALGNQRLRKQNLTLARRENWWKQNPGNKRLKLRGQQSVRRKNNSKPRRNS